MAQIRLTDFIGVALILACTFALPVVSKAQYQIAFGVFGSGGGALSGSSYSINGTAGQPDVGSTSNSSDINDAGFWYLQSNTATGIRSKPGQIPGSFQLDQNYPNPFNPTTTIRYELPAVSHVSLKVYDILGREVATLVDRKETAGSHSIKFDGSRFASGVYFYRLVAGSFVSVKKLVVLK